MNVPNPIHPVIAQALQVTQLGLGTDRLVKVKRGRDGEVRGIIDPAGENARANVIWDSNALATVGRTGVPPPAMTACSG